MTPLDLTIVIPARNEEKNLPGCLAAIGAGFAKDVVVVDSGSTDRTVEIARAGGARTLNFEWNGQFPKKRNWFLRNHPPETQWVMFLDADEYLTETFKAELRRALADSRKVGYWLYYSVHFLGKELKAGYPLRKLALFRTGAGEYEKIEEDHWSQLDMEVHEHPVLSGEIGQIRSKIAHQDFRGVSHYITKHNDYSSWEAHRFLASAGNQAERGTWTWKQRAKYRLMRTPWIGPIYFLGAYLVLGGFRDGSRGLAFALLKMAYFTQIHCKIRELEAAREPAGSPGSPDDALPDCRWLPWIRGAAALTWVVLAAAVLYLSWLPEPRLGEQVPMPGMLSFWGDAAANQNLRTAVPFLLLGGVSGTALAAANARRGRWFLHGALMVGLAAIAELGQLLIPARTCDPGDIAWASTGAAAGLAAAWIAGRAVRTHAQTRRAPPQTTL